MCIIVDANQAGELAAGEKPYIKVLLDWIKNGGALVSAGKLEEELFRHSTMRDLLVQLSRSGQVRRVEPERVNETADRISSLCRSNDPHVIALALEANTNVIVTADRLLIKDLKNIAIVGRRRRIYKENAASPQRVKHLLPLLQAANCI